MLRRHHKPSLFNYCNVYISTSEVTKNGSRHVITRRSYLGTYRYYGYYAGTTVQVFLILFLDSQIRFFVILCVKMFRAPLIARNVARAAPKRAMGGHGGHGHAAPSDGSNFPKWIQALEQAPRAQVIASAIGVSTALAGLIFSISVARGRFIEEKDQTQINSINSPIFLVMVHFDKIDYITSFQVTAFIPCPMTGLMRLRNT